MNNINLHICWANIKYETRILKETRTLADSALVDKVLIVGIWEGGVKEHEELDSRREVWRVPLGTRYLPNGDFWKALKYIEWMVRVFVRFKREHITLVNCHSLPVLPLGMFFKMFVGSKVVYDAHELETEVCGMSGIRRILSKLLERLLIYRVDIVVVVSNSIARWYKNQYNLEEVHVIKNVPYEKHSKGEHSNILKERFSIQDDEILFIYQGVLGKSRGIEILLNVFSQVDKKKHIVFMGYGILESMVKKYESQFSNIHFQPAVRPEEVFKYTSSADIGVHLLENNCLNHFYSLPNKFFEYVFGGLPLIVSDFPDMGEIIDDYECGWKVSADEKSVADLIENISKEDIREKRSNVLKCRDNFSWDKEERKLLKIYRNLSSHVCGI